MYIDIIEYLSLALINKDISFKYKTIIINDFEKADKLSAILVYTHF